MTEDQKDYLAVLAYVFLQNNKFGEAEALLRLLREMSPADPRVTLSLAYALLSLGDPAAALRELDAMPLDTSNEEAALHLRSHPGASPEDTLSALSSVGFAATWIRAKAFYALGYPDSAASVLHDFYLQHGDKQLAAHLAKLATSSHPHPNFAPFPTPS